MSGRDESLLAGSDLVSFAQNVAPDLRQDILDCLLYAKVTADAHFSSRQAWRLWLNAYQQALASTGGLRCADITDKRLKIHSFKDIRKLPLPVFPGGLALGPLYIRSIDRLMTSEHAQLFFSTWFSSGRSESFQVMPCAMQDEHEAVVLSCGLQMTTLALRPALYFWQIMSGEMHVHAVCTAFRFSRMGYEPFRQRVNERIAEHAAQEIMRL
ncbi:hypothetical protein G7013_12295 [Pseudomonas viridiflava]|uniref:hypothetical protein n=1 Tax=Pseudomonas viridiflava TaxID=33069 RepID=UPI0015E485BF|nr:hypothetical protein [Pseudomonas viridiflava]MBA1230424.1 hypothetical protein [Pseudomonas viridiflava]